MNDISIIKINLLILGSKVTNSITSFWIVGVTDVLLVLCTSFASDVDVVPAAFWVELSFVAGVAVA